MKLVKCYIFFTALIIFGCSQPVHADLNDLGMFGLGFATGTVFHELGHATAILAQGGTVTEIRFQSISGYFNDTDREVLGYKHSVVSLGGYISQTIATEVILQNKDWHQNAFALGWMSLGIFTNITNPFSYYVLGSRQSDLGHYAATGADPLWPALFMVTHATFSLIRIFNQTDIPIYLSQNAFKIELKF